MSRVFLIIFILITIILGSINSSVYAQTEIDSEEKEGTEKIIDNNNETAESEILEFFKVDNNTYKVLLQGKDDDTVVFWKYGDLDDSKSITINNNVNYDGQNFKVKYIYEEAFSNSVSVKNIVIGDEILGFCDSKGNFIETIDGIFQDQKKLESINFGNIKVVFGESCFKDCNNIENIEIPNNMDVLQSECFIRCYNIKNIDLSGIKKINGPSNFEYCNSLKNIGEFNDEVIELPDKTFQYCKKIEINSLKNVAKVGAKCFEACKGLKKEIVTDIKEFGDKCFYNCSFNEVYLKKAEKIGYNAFGACSSLKKIKFGNPNIPFMTNNIAEGSSINEWVYPLNYTSQEDYMGFLSKLKVSRVIWYYNYEKLETEITHGARLNTLKPPPSITRDGYQLEGWYKEPECLNKVNKIADLGEISGPDLVIKDPKLYAKWIANDIDIPKEENNPSEPEEVNDPKEEDNPGEQKDVDDPKDEGNPGEPKDVDDPEEEDNPGEPKDVDDPKDEGNPGEQKDVDDPENEGNPSEPEDVDDPKEEDNPSEPEDVNDPKEEDNPGEPEDVDDPKEEYNPNESEDMSSISHKSKKNNNEIKINNFKYVPQDGTNNNVQIVTNGDITKVMKNNKCIVIYLNSNNKLYYLNAINYGYKGSIKIKSSNIDNKWYYLKDDESLVVNTCANGYDITYYEKLI